MARKTGRYHVGKDGQLHVCQADEGNCPLSGSEEAKSNPLIGTHYTSVKEGNTAIEKHNKETSNGRKSLSRSNTQSHANDEDFKNSAIEYKNNMKTVQDMLSTGKEPPVNEVVRMALSNPVPNDVWKVLVSKKDGSILQFKSSKDANKALGIDQRNEYETVYRAEDSAMFSQYALSSMFEEKGYCLASPSRNEESVLPTIENKPYVVRGTGWVEGDGFRSWRNVLKINPVVDVDVLPIDRIIDRKGRKRVDVPSNAYVPNLNAKPMPLSKIFTKDELEKINVLADQCGFKMPDSTLDSKGLGTPSECNKKWREDAEEASEELASIFRRHRFYAEADTIEEALDDPECVKAGSLCSYKGDYDENGGLMEHYDGPEHAPIHLELVQKTYGDCHEAPIDSVFTRKELNAIDKYSKILGIAVPDTIWYD